MSFRKFATFMVDHRAETLHTPITIDINEHKNFKVGDDITVLQSPWQRENTFRHVKVSHYIFKVRVYKGVVSPVNLFKKYCEIKNKDYKKEKFVDMEFIMIWDIKKMGKPRGTFEKVPIEWCVKGKVFFPQYPNYDQKAQIEKWKRICDRIRAILVLRDILDGGIIRHICEFI